MSEQLKPPELVEGLNIYGWIAVAQDAEGQLEDAKEQIAALERERDSLKKSFTDTERELWDTKQALARLAAAAKPFWRGEFFSYQRDVNGNCMLSVTPEEMDALKAAMPGEEAADATGE